MGYRKRVWLSNKEKGWCKEKGWAIKRMDNERDSLGAFHMRIATYDSGWVNATAEQDGLSHGFGYK